MSITRRTFTGSLAAALASGLEGCEKDPNNGASMTTLRMQSSWINDAEFMGYYAAVDKKFDYYDKAGIRVEYIPGGPSVIPETSLLNGKADVALTTPETTAQYIIRDKVDLKIIGAQYQKSPIGVISLSRNPIRTPADLKGKKLAVAPVNRLVVDALFKLNSISPNDVEIVPYTYDPRLLLSGAADASVDFTTNLPYTLKQLGADPASFLLYDFGLTLYNDTVVVTKKVLDDKFDQLVRWMVGSIQGWQENFKGENFERLPRMFADSWLKDNGRTIDNEIEFNRNQYALIVTPNGILDVGEVGIRENLKALEILGLGLPPGVFDTRVLDAARTKLKA